MSFPSDPQLGAIHTVDRRLWTFNGEGWEQGRQILSPPAEDPGSPLVPPVVGPIYIPLLLSYADADTYVFNVGDTNDPTSPTRMYRDNPAPVGYQNPGLQWLSPRYGSSVNSNGSPIAGRGSIIFPDNVSGAPPYDAAFNFLNLEPLISTNLPNKGHCYIVAFKPSSAWTANIPGPLLSFTRYYSLTGSDFTLTIGINPSTKFAFAGVSYGDDFSQDYAFLTPTNAFVVGQWNYMIVQFLFSQASSPPPFFSQFDITMYLNGIKYTGSNNKAVPLAVDSGLGARIGTMNTYFGGGTNDANDGYRFRGEIAEIAYRPDGFGVYNWIDDTRAAALWAAFQTGV